MTENYDKTLELFKKLQENGATDATASRPSPMQQRQTSMTGDVSALTEAVFGKYNPDTDNDTSSGQKRLMETMKEFENGNVSEETMNRVKDNIKNSKIPKAILESMMAQPLIETKIGGDDIDEFMAKTMKKNTNIEASTRIIQKLNENDTANSPQLPKQPAAQSVDYNRLAELVENAVERKLNEYIGKQGLNETKNQNTPSLMAIQMVESGKFMMVDTDSNVYECTLVYKGKNKRR